MKVKNASAKVQNLVSENTKRIGTTTDSMNEFDLSNHRFVNSGHSHED